jgi:hypothetical protein
MKKQRTEYGPSQGAQILHGLRMAAEQIRREQFEKIVNPAPVQLKFKFD